MKTMSFFQTLLLLVAITAMSFSSLFAQVQGTVRDAKDSTVIVGATVVIKNTHFGVTTDPQGKYRLQAIVGDTLLFTFVGYQKAEHVVTGPELNVALSLGQNMLSEVMVTGYFTKQTMTTMAASCSIRDGYNDSEEYNATRPNTFQTALSNPLSTFSIDVDAASYANMRRFINNGNVPPVDAIRTEELINYFNYDYPEPTGTHPVNILTEVSECPWNNAHRLVHIGLKAKNIAPEKLPASNLVFLIDVSGSMNAPNKLPLLQASLKLLTSQIRPIDRVAIVTYAGNAAVALPSTTGDNKARIIEAIEQLSAEGSTAGAAGIRKAYEIARKHFIADGNNRVILATDGDFNVGISSEQALEALIEQERESGIFLTVLGFGMGNYKDNKLQTLAQKGNGNHAYIDNLSEAKKVLVEEFCSSLYTIAKDVKLQIEFNPAKVEAYRLIGYESRLLAAEDFNNDAKDAGEIGLGHTVTALYEIIPAGTPNPYIDPLKYQQQTKPVKLNNSTELMTIKLRYKDPDKNKSKKIEQTVMDKSIPLAKTSDNFRFSAAVAGFGMQLCNSVYSNQYTYDQVTDLARNALGNDREGYRREFIRLVEAAALLKQKK